MRPSVCIDFDGTIVDHRFPEIGSMKEGVREALKKIHETHYIIISSSRNRFGDNYVEEMEDFLIANNLPYDEIDRGNGKPHADAYIDDRGIRFTNWKEVVKQFEDLISFDSI